LRVGKVEGKKGNRWKNKMKFALYHGISNTKEFYA
jgi:hypothetical protein